MNEPDQVISVSAKRSARRRRWRGVLAEASWACLGWIMLWPLTLVVRRRSDLVAFHGRDGGKFLDNCKHLFSRATERQDLHLESVYLTTDTALRDALRKMGALADVRSSLRGLWLWLRAGTLIVDSVDWSQDMRFPASRGARIVQLWHGIPLKQVQLGRIQSRRSSQPAWERILFALYLRSVGRLATLDWFLSTSRFVTDQAFARSFRYKQISHAGYPRNDVLAARGNALAEYGTDPQALDRIAGHRANGGGKVGLYAPTFRESMEDPFANGSIDLDVLSRSAEQLGMLLLIKLHPWMHGRTAGVEAPGIVFVAPDSDIYPLLRELDFLVTDYSSIFFDFLLLDRPVIFFPYDLDNYLASERPMYYDYATMTPGPKSMRLEALVNELQALITGPDKWAGDRARVRSLVFDEADGSAADRLLNELFRDPATSPIQLEQVRLPHP